MKRGTFHPRSRIFTALSPSMIVALASLAVLVVAMGAANVAAEAVEVAVVANNAVAVVVVAAIVVKAEGGGSVARRFSRIYDPSRA